MTDHQPPKGNLGPDVPPQRERLPNRRLAVTIVVEVMARPFLMAVGFYDDGRAGEIFLTGVKTGTHLEGMINDGCVLMSMLLQHGWRPRSLAPALGGRDEEPASFFSTVLRKIAELEDGTHQGITAAIQAARQRESQETERKHEGCGA